MSKARIAFTVPRRVAAEVHRAAKKHARGNVSAWLTQAAEHELERQRRREGLKAVLAELEAESGPATSEDRAWAKKALWGDE